jgi:hypothetical protein
MAINQQPMSRQITMPAVSVSSGSGLAQLAESTSQLGQLVTEKINEVAIDKAALQGMSDVQEGTQPEKLAVPFTRATRAYNNAVSNTEARRMTQSAQDLINESLIRHTDPASFTRETPAKFHAELQGITEGILQHTRDENREAIRESLNQMSAHASLKMLSHSLDYDNKKTQSDMNYELTELMQARRNAAIAGDLERIAGIDAVLQKSVSDYSAMNQMIADKAPQIIDSIKKQQMIDGVLMGYTESLSNKSTASYLNDLKQNKQNLPFDVWNDAVSSVTKLDGTEKRLKSDIQAEQLSQLNYGIENGLVTSPKDLLNFPDISVPQAIAAQSKMEKVQAKELENQKKIINVQRNILSGNSAFLTGSTKNELFQSQVDALQSKTKAPASLQDMANIILGNSDYPASGLPNTPLGSNVPQFDATLSAHLTSGDPMQTAQAAMIFENMVKIHNQPNSVDLDGKALAVATLFNTLNQGNMPPDKAAELAINSVLHAKDPDVLQRSEYFHKNYEGVRSNGENKTKKLFKESLGERPQVFASAEAYRVFKDTFRSFYIDSNSEEAALKAAKYSMRSWGTSKYFDKGYVGNVVPEKELPIAQISNALDNQFAYSVQGFIARNQALREQNPDLNIPVIEWASKDQKTVFDSKTPHTEDEKVLRLYLKQSSQELK